MALITIVGAGMMGSTMAVPARDNGHEVRIVGTHLDGEIIRSLRETGIHPGHHRKLPEGIAYYTIDAVEEALQGADLLICGVSSFGVEWFAENILPLVPESMPVLSITKGLQVREDGSLQPFPELLAERIAPKKLSLNAVGGPCTSYEMADRHHTEVVFCGENIEQLRLFKSWLETDYYHVSVSTDVYGVECAVAMKNAYALGVSLAVGLGQKRDGMDSPLDYNAQAALFGQSVREMSRWIALLGGRPENIVYAAGDLYVTIFGGRTRLLGTLLGRGLTIDEALAELNGVTLESLSITRRVAESLVRMSADGRANPADFPLLSHINKILNKQGEAKDIPWTAFTTEMQL